MALSVDEYLNSRAEVSLQQSDVQFHNRVMGDSYIRSMMEGEWDLDITMASHQYHESSRFGAAWLQLGCERATNHVVLLSTTLTTLELKNRDSAVWHLFEPTIYSAITQRFGDGHLP